MYVHRREYEPLLTLRTFFARRSTIQIATSILSQNSILYLATFFRFAAGLTLGIWGATYFKGSFPDSTASYALTNAVVVGVFGGSSAILGGQLSTTVGKRYGPDNRLLIPAIGR